MNPTIALVALNPGFAVVGGFEVDLFTIDTIVLTFELGWADLAEVLFVLESVLVEVLGTVFVAALFVIFDGLGFLLSLVIHHDYKR